MKKRKRGFPGTKSWRWNGGFFLNKPDNALKKGKQNLENAWEYASV